MVHNANAAGTSQRKRTRRKRSSKPSNPPLASTKQPSMGLASLRQHHHQQTTLRRSEECLNSTPDSSTSSPEESTSDPENRDPPNPIWTRRGPPPADTDTLPSSEDEYPPEASESPVHQRIFVKDSNGAFIGVTPNQLHHLKYSGTSRNSPQETRRKNR